ncbi:MAG TPA: nuclear transport factor 2 family protein [Solirubrobacteraceae bacterium]|nr:nuclear transport factor 2 family protein [Solirubrobacteraceae bacterium]
MSEHSASALATRYINALVGGGLDRARTLLSDDFRFQGPGMQQAVDRETFLSELAGKYEHVSDVRILRQAESDGQVASLYELDAQTPHGATTLLMTEWNTVRDGRIESALLVFDTAPGAQLHAGARAHSH